MKVLRKIVEINEDLCNGCGECVPSCAEGALKIIDGKARLVSEIYCDGLGACLGGCPQGAIKIVEREADDFDEAAVEHYLKEKEKVEKKEAAHKPHSGCPSGRIQMFGKSCDEANQPVSQSGVSSALTQWPIQIRLVAPAAPFLKGADLLVAADCAPAAYPAFHSDFLRGKVLMIGCPKFDNADEYVARFADIFRTAGIKSVTILFMEVPCCSGLPAIVKKSMILAGKDIPIEGVVVSTRGEILNRMKLEV